METIIITFENNTKKEYVKGIKLSDVIKDAKENYQYDIICGSYRNQIINYDDVLTKSGKLELYDLNSKIGNKMYERGLTLLFTLCAREVLGKNVDIKVKHSIDKGIFCEIKSDKLNKDTLKQIKSLMKEKQEKAIPFTKIETSKAEAMEYFKNIKRKDKIKTLSYDNSSFITLYKVEGTYNYILGDLPNDTSVLKYFDLTLIEDKGIVLRFPSIYDNGRVIKYTHHENYFNSIEEYSNWGNLLNINNLGELNEAVINNNAGEIIHLSEMIQDYKLLSIAEEITLNKDDIKIILLSGPSSSGKTTTSKKLSLYLKTLGMKPIQLSLDDYFLNREDTPLDENGKPDFESLRAIDIKLFNTQIEKLLKGSKVITPTFDFISGKKVFDKTLEMDKSAVLVIEGLHALNDELLTNIEKKHKYKIYISPFNSLTIDRHNHISTVDMRFLRRMVRDNLFRGYPPEKTLATWKSVRDGEKKYLFPHLAQANTVLNTCMIYEIGVLKVYAEPLLYSIKPDSPYYEESRRILNFMNSFFAIPSEFVPNDSIIREFIGGSYFNKE